MTINFNVSPYYDDYNENDNYYRILFRPGTAVQARELTQLQTMLQQQIARFGKHMFEEGAMVIPGQASVQTNVSAVKLATNITPSVWQNKNIKSSTTGVTAKVIKAIAVEGTDKATLIVNFTSTGIRGAKQFVANETLTILGTSTTVNTASSDVVTKSSVASINRGVYFTQGFFVLVEPQIIALNKYNNKPSFRIGLTLSEDLITAEDDSKLYDNALGSYNSNAPGAHRYKIDLILDKLSLTSQADEDFIELIRIEDGVLTKLVNRTEYAELEKTLARRTYDESGNYTVSPFVLKIREHRRNNRGTWRAGMRDVRPGDVVRYKGNTYVSTSPGVLVTGSTPPTVNVGSASDGVVTWNYVTKPFFNSGLYTPEDGGKEDQFGLVLSKGKAYVYGYEIEKIAESVIPVRKPRKSSTVSNESVATPIGNYVYVQNIFNAPTITNYGLVSLYSRQNNANIANNSGSGDIVGTARVRDLTYETFDTTFNTKAFRLSLFDISMNEGKSFVRDVKHISAGNSLFNAKVLPTLVKLEGQANAFSSTTLEGARTEFVTQLKVGDYIYIANGANTRRVTSITNSYTIGVDSAVSTLNSAIYLLTADLKEINFTQLLFPVQNSFLANTSTTSFVVTNVFSGTSDGAGALQITGASYPTSALSDDFVFINKTTGNTNTASTITVTASDITFTGLVPNTPYTIIHPEKRDLATPKTKTKTYVLKTISDTTALSRSVIPLGVCDAISIDSIKMESSPGNYSINVSDWYYLDDGQRDTHYDVARIVRRAAYPAPTGNLQVYLSYFAHGTGDYFTVNSYSSIPYSEIPVYKNIRLADVFDFRPRKSDAEGNFTGAGSSLTKLPRLGFETTSSYSYYLGRNDKLALNNKGTFFVKLGVDQKNPPIPDDPSAAMVLYSINYSPYGVTTQEPYVTSEEVEHKRYTMQDISDLEKRIKNVEYYTSLTLLELTTEALSVTDSVTGLNRFKNGFVVENFKGHGMVSDPDSREYRCAIDFDNNALVPPFTVDVVNMVEENSTTEQRTTAGYQKTGDTITLPYTETSFVSQPYASRYEYIKTVPGVVNNLGDIQLVPPSDFWFDTTTGPEIIRNVEGNYNTLLQASLNAKGPEDPNWVGTIVGEWRVTWEGVPYVTDVQKKTTSSYNSGAWYSNGNNCAFNGCGFTGGYTSTTQTTTTYYAKEQGRQKTDISSTLVETIDKEKIGDKLVSSRTIPFMRSIDVLFIGRSLQPYSNVNAFFSGRNMADYVIPASQIKVNGTTLTLGAGNKTFDDVENNEVYDEDDVVEIRRANVNARITDDASERSLNSAYTHGDLIYVWKRLNSGGGSYTEYDKLTTPSTAILAMYENSASGNIFHVVNVKEGAQTTVASTNRNFAVNDIIKGYPSGATITVTSNIISMANLVTNADGDVAGIFTIPNNDEIKIPAKTPRRFILTDGDAAFDPDAKTRAVEFFEAHGTLDRIRPTFRAVRNGRIAKNSVTTDETRLIYPDPTVENQTTYSWYEYNNYYGSSYQQRTSSSPRQADSGSTGWIGKCFIAGQRVLLSNNTYKNIENIQTGDIVQGISKTNCVISIDKMRISDRHLVSINKGQLIFTRSHALYDINNKLVSYDPELSKGISHSYENLGVYVLQTGTILKKTNNQSVLVDTIEVIEYPENTFVYNLVLEGDYTYSVNDILTHNGIEDKSFLNQ